MEKPKCIGRRRNQFNGEPSCPTSWQAHLRQLLEERPDFKVAYEAHYASLTDAPVNTRCLISPPRRRIIPALASELSYYTACRKCRIQNVDSPMSSPCILCGQVYCVGSINGRTTNPVKGPGVRIAGKKVVCVELGGYVHVECLRRYKLHQQNAEE